MSCLTLSQSSGLVGGISRSIWAAALQAQSRRLSSRSRRQRHQQKHLRLGSLHSAILPIAALLARATATVSFRSKRSIPRKRRRNALGSPFFWNFCPEATSVQYRSRAGSRVLCSQLYRWRLSLQKWQSRAIVSSTERVLDVTASGRTRGRRLLLSMRWK